MNEVIIDVRGLSHEEKEKRIFPALEKIELGKGIKLVFDFNPLPLVYLLKARDEFSIAFEKEGPKDWVLNVRRVAPGRDRKEDFKNLLKDLKRNPDSEKVKEKAKEIFKAVDAKTLGLMEQELIREGISHEEIRKSLCDIHLKRFNNGDF